MSLIFCIKWALVIASHMQTMPLKQNIFPLCLFFAIQVIELQKLSYVLFALNITFIRKNLRQKFVAFVALNCLTWNGKSVCQFKHGVNDQPDLCYASTEPAWLVSFFCSRRISVVHLRCSTSSEYEKFSKKYF